MEIKDKLYILADKCTKYYSKMENRFTGEPQLNIAIPREQRILLIMALSEELAKLPIEETTNGITLAQTMEPKLLALLALTTHDITAGLLRGKGSGRALYKKDCRYVDKWTPLVMYTLKEKYGLKYEDFWIKENPLARVLLGKELKDLTVPIIESELILLKKSRSYVVSGLGHRLKKPKNPDYLDEEQVTESDEDRPNFKDRSTRIIRPNSTLVATYNDDYPQSYGIFDDCLSKKYMLDLINHYIIKSTYNGEF